MDVLRKIFAFFLAVMQTVWPVFTGNEYPQILYIPHDAAEYQTFEGFGTSSCWWSQDIDNVETADEIARLLYDDETGLGLDIYRYNIGGGERENTESRIWDYTRRTHSFYVYNEATGKYEYDFTRDANARRMLDSAVKYGAKEIILFCNSPHFSMTASGHASGGLTANFSNLPRENYQAFVDYVLTIADWFVAEGYPVTAVSPINEPQWGWGGEWVGQEGCHYTADETVELLELFALTMQERNSPYKLSGPETGEISEGYYEYIDKFFESEILNGFCDTFSGHAYWMDNNIWGKTAAAEHIGKNYPDKKYEMSEWCELPQKIDTTSIESGLYMANIIHQDLTIMNAVSWQSWTAVNGDGLLYLNTDGSIGYHNRYYAFKQFTSFIEPGMVRVEVKDSFKHKNELTYLAFRNSEKTVYIVINNTDDDKRAGIGSLCGTAEVWQTSADQNCEKIHSGRAGAKQILPAKSITTFVVTK